MVTLSSGIKLLQIIPVDAAGELWYTLLCGSSYSKYSLCSQFSYFQYSDDAYSLEMHCCSIWMLNPWQMSICPTENVSLLSTAHFSSICASVCGTCIDQLLDSLQAMQACHMVICHGDSHLGSTILEFPYLAHGQLTRMKHGSSSILEFASH